MIHVKERKKFLPLQSQVLTTPVASSYHSSRKFLPLQSQVRQLPVLYVEKGEFRFIAPPLTPLLLQKGQKLYGWASPCVVHVVKVVFKKRPPWHPKQKLSMLSKLSSKTNPTAAPRVKVVHVVYEGVALYTGFCPYRAWLTHIASPRALPWADSCWPFRPFPIVRNITKSFFSYYLNGCLPLSDVYGIGRQELAEVE